MAFNWELLGQTVGIFGLAVGGIYGVWQGHRRGSGKPPENRPPPQNETRAALEALRDRIDRQHGLADDDRRDLRRQLDRIERSVERLCDRLDADARIGSALARLRNND